MCVFCFLSIHHTTVLAGGCVSRRCVAGTPFFLEPVYSIAQLTLCKSNEYIKSKQSTQKL